VPDEPLFLSEEAVVQIHDEQIGAFGGLHGLRDPNGLASAVSSAIHVFFYQEGATVFDVAGAYAYYISMSQAFLDGNKRTGLQAAISFLKINGYRVETDPENLFAWIINLHSSPEARQALICHLTECSVREGGFTMWLRSLLPW
jgi:death-on-curing protein